MNQAQEQGDSTNQAMSAREKIQAFPTGENEAHPKQTIEYQAAEELAYLLQYLELNNEMERYLILYRLLASQVLDGMRISKELRDICQEKKISLLSERMDMITGYNDYLYMQRKWKKEIRRQKQLSKMKEKTKDTCNIEENNTFPAWNDVIHRITAFGKPLWESLCGGKLFVGDWMPELERFLD